MYQNSDFIEKEQPELSAETKWLIAQYQQEPNETNYLELREMVIENYNAVLERKEDKLAELKTETAGKPGGEEIVAEMEALVQEMYVTYWDRINASMLRFTDPRLLEWKTPQAARYDYIPVMGAGESIYIKCNAGHQRRIRGIPRRHGRAGAVQLDGRNVPRRGRGLSRQLRLLSGRRSLLRLAHANRRFQQLSPAERERVGAGGRTHAEGRRFQLRRKRRQDACRAICRRDKGRAWGRWISGATSGNGRPPCARRATERLSLPSRAARGPLNGRTAARNIAGRPRRHRRI